MKLKWTGSYSKYITKRIPTVEKDYDGVIWCIVLIMSMSGIIYLLFR